MNKNNETELKGGSELSRLLKVDGIPRAGIEERIVAKPAERAALAKRLRIVDLKRFEANITVEHEKGRMLTVTGGIYAELTQECVVTLEPIDEVLRDNFDILMAPDYVLKKRGSAPIGEYAETEAPEPIEGGILDLGEIAVQHLAMSIDPYPRKEGAAWAAVTVGESQDYAEPKAVNPFLKLLKDKK